MKLAILAGGLHLAGYAVYNTATLSGASSPNLVPWAIWGVLAVLNNRTYKAQTGDKAKAMLTSAGAIAAVITFFVALYMGGTFRNLSTMNAAALTVGAISIVVWKMGSAKYANYCVLTAAAAGFVPFVPKVWANPGSENWVAWLLWSTATTLGVVVVWMRDRGVRSDYVMPVSLAVLHTGLFLLIVRPF